MLPPGALFALRRIRSRPHAGTRYENQSVAQTVIGSAKSREDALIFGHASEALNNGFFLSCLVRQRKPSVLEETAA